LIVTDQRFHEVAGIFPMMSVEEIDRLAEDIKANGQKEPIYSHDGLIVDGRNRFMACRRAGVEPWVTPWNGKGDLIDFVVSLNLHRRHLNESQRAMAGDRIAGLRRGANQHTEISAPTQGEVAARLSVSEDSIQFARKVHDLGSAELVEAVEQGKIAVSLAAKIASAPAATQKAIVEKVDAGAKPTEAARQVRREQLGDRVAALPVGKNRVIYADPPWRYGDSRAGLEVYEGSAAEAQYPTMSAAEICALDVKALAADDAVLFCWATFPLLPDALDVIHAWGFVYKTAIVWDKVRPNLGNYHNASAELLLVCTRGSCTPEIDDRIDQVQTIKRETRHSEKPEAFRELIDKLYPSGPRIELFRRGEAPRGWTIWGNEAAA
jgi:N6-adenosine-specific RNA methylase IME4